MPQGKDAVTTDPVNPALVDEARGETDAKLGKERERVTHIVDDKLRPPERHIEDAKGEVRAEADAELTEARHDARHAVRDHAGEPKEAKAAIEAVAERVEEAVGKERQRVDELTAHEREDRKRAFIEILSQERRDTDVALFGERVMSDDLVRSRDEVLAMISHDLRNLLSAINMKVDLLASRLPDEMTFEKKLAREVLGSFGVMARWAGDLVDLASLDSGSLALRRGSHDPKAIATHVVDAFRAKAAKKSIGLAVVDAGPLPNVDCDRDRIEQVLGNLLDNALKFTPSGGSVTLRVEPVEDMVGFSVSDSGVGIPEEDAPRVFERQWHTQARHGGGTGFGLYIAKRVVESHGGRIWVETRPNQGATFFFTLPVAR